MAEPELLFPLAENNSRSSDRRSALEPLPGVIAVSQPVAVYLQWLVLGTVIGAFALHYSLGSAIDVLAQILPRWSQVAGAGVMAILVLLMIERSKRDRRGLAIAFGAVAATLAGLSLQGDLLASHPTGPGWFLVVGIFLCGVLHLVWMEDWVIGRRGPRFTQFAAALHDLATARWWFWFSKRAIQLRAEDQEKERRLRSQRELEQAARSSAEYRSALATAERKAKEDALAVASAAAETARIEHATAALRSETEDTQRRASEVEERRTAAELRVAAARKETEELNRQAEAAALERTRLKNQQMEAERHFFEAAVMARSAAETAVERGVEAARAQELLDRIRAEIPLGDYTPH